MDITSTLTLNNGAQIPRLGLGVYLAGAGRATEDAVRWALEAGYRHIDTASVYRNEPEVGVAIRDAIASGLVEREEVFVCTKLWNDNHGYDAALRAFDASLRRLRLEYVDLYLVHWPVEFLRRESWRALERIFADGKARAIGVSNYTIRHLTELLDYAKVTPAVNQVELHPFLQQRELVEFCSGAGIVVEAYSPLTKGQRLDDSRLVAVAMETGQTPAQILIRWSLQKELVVIAKSSNERRVVENASVFDFELNADQMARLDALEADLHTAWNPASAP
jgi:diketogulonate reductase-like aldo/keto reductase